MSFDGLFLHHLLPELTKSLVGGRIQKINQPFNEELILSVRANGKTKKLLLSAHSVFGRLQLTTESSANPKEASTFVMVLRKYLAGAVIENIVQIGNDRQLHFHISTKNEIGDWMRIVLIVEIMGKHSNIILVNRTENKIIEAIKHVGFSQNKFRTILPGSAYLAPPASGAKNPFDLSDSELFSALKTQAPLEGMGRENLEKLRKLPLEEFLSRIHHVYPSYYPKDDRFSSVRLSDEAVKFDSLSSLLDSYYKGKSERDHVKQMSIHLIRLVSNELLKNQKKLAKQTKELAATDDAEIFRQKGELLNSFLPQVPKDKDQITLENYYTGQPLTILLDKSRTPAQNAQRYFQRYQKLKQAVKFLTQQIKQTKETLDYLASVETLLENAELGELADLQEELTQAGFVRRRKNQKKHYKPAQPTRYKAPDGTILLVGKNNLQNEQVTFKFSKKGDLWFHTKDIPGSHVLITGNSNPSDETITFAGELAAYYSKARHSNLVAVDMIDVKKIHKPTGTPPGFVTYTGQKTIRVRPNEETIHAAEQENSLKA